MRIIRCKDCKYGKHMPDCRITREGKEWNEDLVVCLYHRSIVTDDDFCSKGEGKSKVKINKEWESKVP